MAERPKGVDVHGSKGPVNWARVRAAGYSFAFVKQTEGATFKDARVAANVQGAQNAGMLVGRYHFSRPDNNTVAAEVKNFLETNQIQQGELMPVLDFEKGPPDLGFALAWLRAVGKALYGRTWFLRRRPILYTYPDYLRQALERATPAQRTAIKRFPLWYASYGPNDGKEHPVKAPEGFKLVVHQFTSKGAVPGIRGDVDLNSAHVALKDLVFSKPAPPKPASDELDPMRRAVIQKPWTRSLLRFDPKVRRYLDTRGLVTPNFSWKEAASKDGTPVPHNLRKNAIRHAWRLEKLRHKGGDKAIPILSWYRTPAHNAAVGGARKSQHMNAWATDIREDYVNAFPGGRSGFFKTARSIWRLGGLGDYPGGTAHCDSRPTVAFWRSFIGQ